MEGHFQDILYALGTVFAVWGVIQKSMKDMKERIDKRFDAIEERLARVEQNHIDHLTTLHVNHPVSFQEKGDIE